MKPSFKPVRKLGKLITKTFKKPRAASYTVETDLYLHEVHQLHKRVQRGRHKRRVKLCNEPSMIHLLLVIDSLEWPKYKKIQDKRRKQRHVPKLDVILESWCSE
uniref:Ovule protein n=1 Tax=Steinernema glaseri TaxID=37863 RepID=A0A1I7Y6L4_9BILA